jgi:hypothetical protein
MKINCRKIRVERKTAVSQDLRERQYAILPWWRVGRRTLRTARPDV